MHDSTEAPKAPEFTADRIEGSDGSKLVFMKPTTEPVLPFIQASAEILERYDGPLDVVLDIGAHIGTFSLLAAQRGAKFILAFEPDPRNYDCLRVNVEENGFRDKILPLPLAVSTRNLEIAELHRAAGDGGNSGQSSICLSFSENPRKFAVFTVAFRDVLAELVQEKGKIDFLKLDVEGAEWAIFQDLMNEPGGVGRWMLEKHVGYVDLELHMGLRSQFESQITAAKNFMDSLGFKGELIVVGDAARYCGRKPT